jgi:hypothetical protein
MISKLFFGALHAEELHGKVKSFLILDVFPRSRAALAGGLYNSYLNFFPSSFGVDYPTRMWTSLVLHGASVPVRLCPHRLAVVAARLQPVSLRPRLNVRLRPVVCGLNLYLLVSCSHAPRVLQLQVRSA